MSFKAFCLCGAAVLACAAVAAPAEPAAWMNTALSADQRADLVEAQMTRAEKLTLVHGYFGTEATINPHYPPPPEDIRKALPAVAGYIPGIARLGIPAQIETDASLGVSNQRHARPGDTATALPATLATASSFNPEIAYAVGGVVGQETRDKGFNVLLNGGVDLARDPRNGRNFEYAGEDPLLAGLIAGAAIKGAQSKHIISTAKHYAVNDQEIGRDWLSANLSEQAKRESDLLAFEIAIEQGQPGSIMCAYNRVNGTYSCENDFLLNKVLKGDWKYPGYVMSDWGGVHSTTKAALAGLDQESAFEFDRDDYFGPALAAALDGPDGAALQKRLDDMVHRILRSMFAHGLIDNPPAATPSDTAAHLAVAQTAAEEGIVLLKNSPGLLPLAAKRIAVIGGRADLGVLSGGGSAQVMPIGNQPEHEVLVGGAGQDASGAARVPLEKMVFDPPSPLAALKAETAAKVVFDDGADLAHAAATARGADVVIVFATRWQREGTDVPDLTLPGRQNDLIAAVAKANPKTVVVLETANPVIMPWLDQVGAVVEAWYPGNRGATAVARILTGKVNPSGHLPISFPQSLDQLPRPVIPGQDLRQPDNRWTPNETLFDVDYTIEGADLGYKWYAKKNLTPLFPFGYGLSYTRFDFGALAVAPGAVSVSFDIKNAGKRSGKAVGQVYATPPGGLARLVAFAKVELKPGESRHVTASIDPRVLASFDPVAQVWRVAAGDYSFRLGASSADNATTVTAHLEATTIKP